VITVVLYRPFLVLSFSRAKAEVLGLRPGLTHLAMLGVIAMVIVTSFQTVGTLLVFAFIVAPPATASLVSRRVPVMMGVAMLVGAIGVVLGLLVSFHAATATAPTIAGITVLSFFLVLTVREAIDLVARRRRGRTPATPAAPSRPSAAV
jgi:ABC-type Mn2+/Zn2+ transport system permease subunit